jgi:sucrose-6-phosphate hydrolase SacC (GH32 family)
MHTAVAMLAAAALAAPPEPFPLRDKTLVAWAAPANLTQRGGSILTIDDQASHFDGIVFGELAPGKWMAGSDFFRRTQRDQSTWPAETAGPTTLVQMAIVYRGTEVTIYRDGQVYTRYAIPEPQVFGRDSAVVFGLRHLEAGDGACFAGVIADARVYAAALTAEQLAALRPGVRGEPAPLGWWDFAGGQADDQMGVFPRARLGGDAKLTGGRLVLSGRGSYLVTPPSARPGPPAPRPPDPAQMPTYHFTSPTGRDCGPFDPNGAIWHRGRYHLGYIYQDGGQHYWGHASSADLLTWRVHPPMLAPGPDGGIFSGNAFVDQRGRVVLSYHGLAAGQTPAGNCLAVAEDDDLNVFRKLAANPVMRNPGWDPHTWRSGDTYYSISGGNPPSLYRSTDPELAQWTLVGKLLTHDLPGVDAFEDLSCPDLFRLGDQDILLGISHPRGARYYVGRFDGERFRPVSHHRMNWPGGCNFAPETLLDGQGRRLYWAWAIGSPSTMTLPRVLTMGPDGALRIAPAEELHALRRNPQSLPAFEVPADAAVVAEGIRGACKELQVTLDPRGASACGVKVRCSPDGAEETVVVYDRAQQVLRIELDKSSLNKGVRYHTFVMRSPNPEVRAQEAPFALAPGEPLRLRLYLDRSILEVYANDRQCLTQRVWPTRADSLGIACLARGGAATVQTFAAWDMAPAGFEALAGRAPSRP